MTRAEMIQGLTRMMARATPEERALLQEAIRDITEARDRREVRDRAAADKRREDWK